MLRAISVFAGVFSVDGATAVSNETPADVVDTLAQLVAKSLLAMDTTGDGRLPPAGNNARLLL